jgi:glucose-6-phosphate isomerase
MHGKTDRKGKAEFDKQGLDAERAKFLLPLKFCRKPTNTILIEKLTQKQ